MGKELRAGIYTRISLDDEGLALGVDRQRKDCHKLATEAGWSVAEEYVDNDISAYSGKRRPAFERMLADLGDGTTNAIAVYHPDRLARSPKDLERFIDTVTTAGAPVRFVTGGGDPATDDGLLMLRIQTNLAAHESATKSRRVKRKLLEVAESGMPHGGSVRPFAYEPDRITIHKDEARILKQIVKRFLAGESLRSIATWLNEEGIHTSFGGPWDTQGLRQVITNPRYIGLRVHSGKVIGKATWKPILTESEHRHILLRFEEIKLSGRRTARRYLLSGLLRCGRCGNRLFSAARVNRRRYVCNSGPDHGGCGKMTVVAGPVEELIADAVL
ncbi:MAG TPA: recombinase family protein, partial [Acidimicrobiales bacterium]|nr:recombinase family protein [Acidimicrobiales bacterium]